MRYNSYADALSQLITDDETIHIISPAGHPYSGKLIDVGPNLLRLESVVLADGKHHEILLNPAHIVSVQVELRKP